MGGLTVSSSRRAHDEDEYVHYPFVWKCNVQRVLDSEDMDEETKARKVVRSNNFTQQTNALDVDKHMCVTTWLRRRDGTRTSMQDGLHRRKYEKAIWE